MDRFSQRQLRIPRLARDVYLIGAAVEETRIESDDTVGRCTAALDAATADLSGGHAALLPYVDGLVLGRSDPEAEEDEAVIQRLGLDPLAAPGASSEGSALEVACWAVASGAADVLVVMAWNAARATCAVLGEIELARTLHPAPARVVAASGSQLRFPGATEGLPPVVEGGETESSLSPALRWALRRAFAQAGVSDPESQLDAALGWPESPAATQYRLEQWTPPIEPAEEGGFLGLVAHALAEIRGGDARRVLCLAQEDEGTRAVAAVIGS